jgi:hypothetical protein
MKWWLLSKAVETLDASGQPVSIKANWSRGFFRLWVLFAAVWMAIGGVFVFTSGPFEDLHAHYFLDVRYDIAVLPQGSGRFAIRPLGKYGHEFPTSSDAQWSYSPIQWHRGISTYGVVRDDLLNVIRGPSDTLAQRQETLARLAQLAPQIAAAPGAVDRFPPGDREFIRSALTEPWLQRVLLRLHDEQARRVRDEAVREIQARLQYLSASPEDFDRKAQSLFQWILEDHKKNRDASLTAVLTSLVWLVSGPIAIFFLGAAIGWVARGFRQH